MSDILNFVEDHKNDDVEELLGLPEFSDVLGKIQEELERCEREDQEKIRAFLKRIEPHIETVIASLKEEASGVKEGISRRNQSAQACVAYLDSARKAHPSKRRK